MSQQHRTQLFDDWAEHYDQSIQGDSGFPFDGYEQVLDEIARAAGAQRGMKVLDLGIGTGNLATRFAGLGCDIWGVDFSARMLDEALKKLPQVVLVQADLLDGWPAELARRFDCFCQPKTGPVVCRKEGHEGHLARTLTIENRAICLSKRGPPRRRGCGQCG